MKCDKCIHKEVCKFKPDEKMPFWFVAQYENCKYFKGYFKGKEDGKE